MLCFSLLFSTAKMSYKIEFFFTHSSTGKIESFFRYVHVHFALIVMRDSSFIVNSTVAVICMHFRETCLCGEKGEVRSGSQQEERFLGRCWACATWLEKRGLVTFRIRHQQLLNLEGGKLMLPNIYIYTYICIQQYSLNDYQTIKDKQS